MHAALRIIAFSLAAGFPAGSMTTCVDIEHATRIYEDGSGKFALTITTLKGEGSDEGEKEPGKEFLEFIENCEGCSAWTISPAKVTGKTQTATLTAYFEDIRKFKWSELPHGEKTRRPFWTFELTRTDTGHALVFRDQELKKWLDSAGQALTPDEKAESSDDRYGFSITVPGRISRVAGAPTPKGRTVEVRLDKPLIFAARKGDPATKKALSALSSEVRLEWSGSEDSKRELEEFKKELAAVKESWKSLEAKARKNAEQEEKSGK